MKFTTGGRVAVLGLMTLTAIIAAAVGHTAAPPSPKSPHAEAMELVLRTQAHEIHKIEVAARPAGKGGDHWWHDTKERSWVVKRPFSPGVIDSTHLFVVSYRIERKEVGRWWVDTRADKATRWDVEK